MEVCRGQREIDTDQPPNRSTVGGERLVLFVQDDWKKAENRSVVHRRPLARKRGYRGSPKGYTSGLRAPTASTAYRPIATDPDGADADAECDVAPPSGSGSNTTST